jgi:hypothetical protein
LIYRLYRRASPGAGDSSAVSPKACSREQEADSNPTSTGTATFARRATTAWCASPAELSGTDKPTRRTRPSVRPELTRPYVFSPLALRQSTPGEIYKPAFNRAVPPARADGHWPAAPSWTSTSPAAAPSLRPSMMIEQPRPGSLESGLSRRCRDVTLPLACFSRLPRYCTK